MRPFLSLLLLMASTALLGQGTVRGKVSDRSGETLIGAMVAVKGQPGRAVGTDYDGNYSITVSDTVPTTIVVSYFGYRAQEAEVNPMKGGVLIRDFVLVQESFALRTMEVEGKARRSGDVYLEQLKVNAPASIDYISRDVMLRTGDGDASAAVKRVTGVSTVGSFVTVRGLADRYIVTSINGSRIPTLDPLTNNLKLDLFPTGLMDNIIITKTATPDLPGDWSGAYISLNTSDYPQRFQVSVATTLGYSTNSSFQDIITSQRSSTDWLGHDDGLRAIPDGFPSDVEDFPGFVEPTLYQQLGILGLQGFLNGYGITANTPAFQGTTMGDYTLQHLALTQLGLLAPALLYDANATAAAVSAYNSTYGLAYFSPLVNGELAELNTKFNNDNWRLVKAQGAPNFNQSISIGNQIQLFKKHKEPKTLGYLIGFRYATETEYDPSSTLVRTNEKYEDTNPGDEYGRKGIQQITTESNGWNAAASLSFKFNPHHSISLMVMPNVLGQNNARYQEFLQPGLGSETFASEDQFYEERKLWVYQFSSSHFIPGYSLKIQSDVSWSDGKRDMLDLRTVQYVLPPPGEPISSVEAALTPPSRIFRTMDETMLDAKIALEIRLNDDAAKPRKLKFGGAWLRNERTNTQAYFKVLGAPGPTQWTLPGRFDMQPDGTFRSMYAPAGTFKDNDIGILNIGAAYAMMDYTLTPRTRIVGGLRAEHTEMLTDILRYYQLDLAPDDPARGVVGDISIPGGSEPEPKPAVPGSLDQWDLLPSMNLIHKLRMDEDAPMNLRASYFRSLGRPSFRELSVVQQWDYILNAPVFGNPDLEMTSIDNFDLRLERFFSNRNNVSLSGFFKQFRDHIELLSTAAGGFTWRNARESRVIGVELEGRVGICKGLEWRGNLTFMHSRSELTTTITERTQEYSTPMFGQAPYIVNSMLSYTADSIGLVASVSYNVQGPKLAVSNSEIDIEGIRAYEMPRHQLDVTVSKNFGKHWGVRLRARDVLSSSFRRAYLFDSGYDVDFDSYNYGPEYALTVSYTIR